MLARLEEEGLELPGGNNPPVWNSGKGAEDISGGDTNQGGAFLFLSLIASSHPYLHFPLG